MSAINQYCVMSASCQTAVNFIVNKSAGEVYLKVKIDWKATICKQSDKEYEV